MLRIELVSPIGSQSLPIKLSTIKAKEIYIEIVIKQNNVDLSGRDV